MGIIGWIGIAAIFYAAAEYEHMSGWQWAIASLAVSGIVDGLLPFSFVFILPAQFVLFIAMWVANARRRAKLEVDRAGRRQEDQRVRQERITAARVQAAADPTLVDRDAKRAAAEEAAQRERQERVRKAREEREREEREQREQRKQG